MGDEITPGRLPTLTEDTRIKTNVKTIVAVITATVVGTAFFLAVMTKLDRLDEKIDAYEKTLNMRIDYLFYATDTHNPFAVGDHATTSRPAPTHRSTNP